MPGVFGYIKPIPPFEGNQFIHQMADALESNPRFRTKTYVEVGFGFGAVRLPRFSDNITPFWDENNNTAIIFYGELYNRLDLIKKLDGKGIFPASTNDEGIILSLYKTFGNNFVTAVNGAFVLIIWESESRTLKIFNDRMGLYPLYYYHQGSNLLFASGIRAMLVDSTIPRNVDQTAIAEFLTFDHILGQRTFFADFKLLNQASILTFSGGKLSIESYYFPQVTQQHPLRSVESYVDEFIVHLRNAVKRQYHGEADAGLMLSGGLDSRFLLTLLNENKKDKLHTFTWSIPGSDDERFAKECAKKAQTDHHFFELPPDWILNKGEQAIRITEGNANIINLHAFANIEQENQFANIIFKGFMGDAMMGFGIRPRFWADYDEHTHFEVHLEAYRDYRVLTFNTPDHHQVFTEPFFKQTYDSWREDFKSGMKNANAKQMADQRIYFDLTQRVPRMTMNGVEVTRSHTMVRLPFADNDLLDFSLTLPPWLRLSRTLINQAFIKYYPEYAKIPIAQTKLPMITCAREIWLKNWQFAQWHLRNHGLNALAGPQSRPYKDYTNWFRTRLKNYVEEILLSKQHLQRGYLKENVIKTLVNEHMAGANHTSRLGAMLSIELWHRLFID